MVKKLDWLTTGLLVLVLAPAVRAQEPAAAPPPPEYYATDPQLRAWVAEALEANPALAEAAARYRAALGKSPQVTALPDPMVTFGQAVRSVETRVGPQLNTVMLSQAFPWFGKLDLREQLAVQDAAAAFERWQARERDVIAEVKAAYHDLAYVDRAMALTDEEQSLVGHYERLAQSRYANGLGLQQAVIRVQAEITRLMSRRQVLRQQRQSLAARLNTLMGAAPERPLPPVAPPAAPAGFAASLDLDALYALALAHRHELKATDALIARAERSAELAKKNYWPDIVVGAGFVNVGRREDPAGVTAPPPDNGKNAWTVSVGVAIPLHRDRLKAAVQQAVDETAAEQAARASIANDVEFAVRDQVVRLQSLDEQVSLFRDVLIPQASEAQRSTESAYETGQVGVLDLLDTERVLFEVRLANARQQADLQVALARLERAVGTKYPQ